MIVQPPALVWALLVAALTIVGVLYAAQGHM